MSELDEQLEELERLEREATPGHWIECGDHPGAPEPFWHVVRVGDSVGNGPRVMPESEDDAKFITLARNLFPQLLEERKALKAENEGLRALLEAHRGYELRVLEGSADAEAEVERLRNLCVALESQLSVQDFTDDYRLSRFIPTDIIS